LSISHRGIVFLCHKNQNTWEDELIICLCVLSKENDSMRERHWYLGHSTKLVDRKVNIERCIRAIWFD